MSVINLSPTSAEVIQMSDRCFDEETTALIGRVFDHICKELPEWRSDTASREVVAKRIIDLAGRGERDPGKIGSEALISLGFKPKRLTISAMHRCP